MYTSYISSMKGVKDFSSDMTF